MKSDIVPPNILEILYSIFSAFRIIFPILPSPALFSIYFILYDTIVYLLEYASRSIYLFIYLSI